MLFLLSNLVKLLIKSLQDGEKNQLNIILIISAHKGLILMFFFKVGSRDLNVQILKKYFKCQKYKIIIKESIVLMIIVPTYVYTGCVTITSFIKIRRVQRMYLVS